MNSTQQQTIERRAIEAAIWGMPTVSFYAMRRAFLEDAGARFNDVVYWSKPSDWMNQITTPTASPRYVWFNMTTKDGPVVVEVPATVNSGLFGVYVNSWQKPLDEVGPTGEDQGKGGKYLILPPDFEGEVPVGYFPVRSQTYNVLGSFRAIPLGPSQQDEANTIAMVKQLKVYPLAQANNPGEQKFIDMSGTPFEGIAPLDESFYHGLAQMVNEEPVLDQDRAMMGLLLSIGIEKGKEFTPNAELSALLDKAAHEAHAWLMEGLLDFTTPHWKDSSWNLPGSPVIFETAFSFERDNFLDYSQRGIGFYSFCVPPKKLGAGTYYVGTFIDSKGEMLSGEKTYRLHVPAKVPAEQFWSLSLYDRETCAFIRGMARPELGSLDTGLRWNDDGSVDLYIGPEAPAGQESNWIPTAPGREWFTYFRFYKPAKILFEQPENWKLPAIEHID